MEKIICFNKTKFRRYQESGRICLLQFWSAWCGDCFDLDHLVSFSKRNRGVYVFRVNYEDNERLASKYLIKVLPSYLFFRDFKVQSFLIGRQNEQSLSHGLFQILN